MFGSIEMVAEGRARARNSSKPRCRCPSPPPQRTAGACSAGDAAAGLATLRLLEEDSPVSEVCCAPCGPFNLLAAMALWVGLAIDPAELRSEVLVVRTVR
ncbi:hypothetical protein [Nonomuraea dietziae]|uniref:Uncharacterized protein n=1 Tax=Nonomuraea dietziae TaxID=65515 RepID=A0A7W5V555_9ACTN|nr:hypothetical protein [Nonomuraea dietziae]MBB3728066.1 hypothetical protein [Nonomuraea dietziae]